MTRRSAPLLLVALAALAYPLAALTGGAPRFPTRGDCVHPPQAGRQLEAVFGRFERQAPAEALLARVRARGFVGSILEGDGCGLLKVDVQDIPNLNVGRSLIAEARAAGFHPMLETVVG
jgi:hypothetical protein